MNSNEETRERMCKSGKAVAGIIEGRKLLSRIRWRNGFCLTIEADIFDVFDNSEDVLLVHQCNCMCTMGAGIAKLIATKYPIAKEVDRKFIPYRDEGRLGNASFAFVSAGHIIANMYGQHAPGSNPGTSYDAVYSGLKTVFDQAGHFCTKSTVLIPYGMSSDIAGGKWKITNAIIESLQETMGVNVIICKLKDKPYLE